MEVHNHAHTARKKWSHYFWEFLMLFLAVFCGFLAENQREHMVEHRREKEFMVSMLSDLKADSSNLVFMHQVFTQAVSHIDSLIPLLEDDFFIDGHAEEIYQQQVSLNLFFKWVYSDRTVNQLKNSGNFRLIRKINVSDEISAYDGYIKNFVGNMQEAYILPQWEKTNAEGTEIFKSSVFRQYMKDAKGSFNHVPIKLPVRPYFVSLEKIRLQKFINLLEQYAVAVEWFNSNTITALKMGTKLDSLIRREYHLE